MSVSESPPRWRIDELARRTDTPVGTVRLYQREGLLPVGQRVGRSMTYGVTHLNRLVRIQQLRAANFTLAAIKRMIDKGQFILLDRVLGTDSRPRSRQLLVHETGLDEDLIEELEALNFLAPPAERGASDYDGGEATVLQAIGELLEIGTPRSMLSVVLPIYVRHVAALEHDLIAIFAGQSDVSAEVRPEDLATYARRTAKHNETFLHRWDVIVDYLHHRMIQRLVHRARSAAIGETDQGMS
jgi:DNA-binding transcriptional MerR regulator